MRSTRSSRALDPYNGIKTVRVSRRKRRGVSFGAPRRFIFLYRTYPDAVRSGYYRYVRIPLLIFIEKKEINVAKTVEKREILLYTIKEYGPRINASLSVFNLFFKKGRNT